MTPLTLTSSLAEAKPLGHSSFTIIDDFSGPSGPTTVPGTWSGFSDRVMGGISDATFQKDIIEDTTCMRLQGRVTKDNGGGFVQMARTFGTLRDVCDASAYSGLELSVYGNNELYNIHLRTNEARWYDQSYRTSIFVAPRWQTFCIPWAAFIPNAIDTPLNLKGLQRIGLLGWMREFEADLALSRIAFYV